MLHTFTAADSAEMHCIKELRGMLTRLSLPGLMRSLKINSYLLNGFKKEFVGRYDRHINNNKMALILYGP